MRILPGRGRPFGWAAAVLAAGMLTSCTGSAGSATASSPLPPSRAGAAAAPGGAAATGTPTAAASSPDPGLAPFYRQTLTWTACPGGRCAQLAVPLDYRHPDRGSATLAVLSLPAAGARRGSLVVNPGGPGASGVAYARGSARLFSAAVREAYDVVGFDPRGVGASTPAVDCVDAAGMRAYLALDPDPPDPAALGTVTQGLRVFAQGCLTRTPAALLAHVGTVDAAKDMDVLRAALGEDALTYYGASYGTLLGATYAALFPSRVRTMVLDGAEDPHSSWQDLAVTQAAGFERDLADFAAGCPQLPQCPAGDPAGITAVVRRLEAAARAAPLPTRLAGRTLSVGELLLGVLEPLYYGRSGWPLLARALSAAAASPPDGTALLQLADLYAQRSPTGAYSNLLAANVAVSCQDRPWPRDESAYLQAAAAAAATAPLFGPYNVRSNLPCAAWPAGDDQLPASYAASGSPPILVVGTTRDPATPYAWAQALAGDLAAGRLLTFDADGHTAYGQSRGCARSAVDAYLVAGTLPATGTVCHD